MDLCPRCRDLVGAFQTEKASLIELLGNADAFLDECEPARARVASPIHVLQLMGLVIGTALLLKMGFDLVMGLQLPWGLAWLNPLQLSGQLSLLFSSGAYIIREGGTIMESLIVIFGFAALASLLFYFVLTRFQWPVQMSVILGILVLAVGLTTPVEAIEVDTSENVSIEADEVIDDTFVVFGRTVRIDGVVTGDLIVFAQTIDIQGSVHGDTFVFGQNIEIEGTAGGGIAVFGEVIRLGDRVGQSVYAFGKSILSRRDATIEGDLFTFGDQITVGGAVGRNVVGYGNSLTLIGEVSRDVTFSGRMAVIHSSAFIGGDLDVDLPSEENLQVDAVPSVAGTINIAVPEERQEETWSVWSVWSFLFSVLWLAGAFISGMILLWALPAFRRQPLVDLRAVLVSVGTGITVLVGIPVVAGVLAVTLIGIPAGLVTAAIWALGLYLSKIVVAHYLGTALFRSKQQDMRSVALPLIVGLVLVLVAVSLPYVGWIINGLLVILGLGTMSQVLYRAARTA